jgi:hypothetical protein
MREGMDSTRMIRHGRDLDFRQMRAPDQRNDSMFMHRMHPDFYGIQGRGSMRGMGSGMGPMRGRGPGMGTMRGMEPWRDDMRGRMPEHRYGMKPHERYGMRGFGQFPDYQMGMGSFRPAGERIGSIPDLTEKQRNEIAAQRQLNQNEMKKLRDDFSGKMQTIREEHRKKLMNLLTDAQKKALEQQTGRTNPGTQKVK